MEEFTRADIEQFFHDIVKNDGKEHMISGVYRLKDLSEPAWLLCDHTFGDIIQKPLDVTHILYVGYDGKLHLCGMDELPPLK